MSQPLPNYLRRYRKRAGLTNQDIAFLLGAPGRSPACGQYELFKRRPSLRTVLAYAAIFGVPVEELFRGMFCEQLAGMKKRAEQLMQVPKGKPGPVAEHRRKAVQAVASGKGSERIYNNKDSCFNVEAEL